MALQALLHTKAAPHLVAKRLSWRSIGALSALCWEQRRREGDAWVVKLFKHLYRTSLPLWRLRMALQSKLPKLQSKSCSGSSFLLYRLVARHRDIGREKIGCGTLQTLVPDLTTTLGPPNGSTGVAAYKSCSAFSGQTAILVHCRHFAGNRDVVREKLGSWNSSNTCTGHRYYFGASEWLYSQSYQSCSPKAALGAAFRSIGSLLGTETLVGRRLVVELFKHLYRTSLPLWSLRMALQALLHTKAVRILG